MSKKNRYKHGKHAYQQYLFRKKADKHLIQSAGEPDSGKEVMAYQSELDYISRCILDCPNIETGGQLFGFYASKGTPVVCYAIGAGLHANHQITFFNQDIDYLQLRSAKRSPTVWLESRIIRRKTRLNNH